jgi:hypothetical protein
MDKIQDFFKELRSRFSSPFFSSFVIAWLIINWRVPIALVFYKSSEFQSTEHKTYFGLVQDCVTTWTGILAPILAAMGYTVVAPALKNIIRALNAFLDAKGMDWSLRAAKQGKGVSLNKYMQLRDSYKGKEAALMKLYEEESEYLNLNSELHAKVDDFRTKYQNFSTSYEILRSYSDLKTYDGNWKLNYLDINSQQREQTVSFVSGNIRATDRGGVTLFKIINLAFSAESRDLLVRVEDHQDRTPNSFYITLYCPDQKRKIFISRDQGLKIERLERIDPSDSQPNLEM